jgi:hypothetical protein
VCWKRRGSWAVGMAQAVECLPGMCEALGSNPNTEKKREREKRQFGWLIGGMGFGFLAMICSIFVVVSPWLLFTSFFLAFLIFFKLYYLKKIYPKQ